MKKKVFKFFLSPKKEEAWLNKMADQGWGVVEKKIFSYVFAEVPPNQYSYKLVIIDPEAKYLKEDSEEEVTYLELADAKVVDRSYSWSILQREKDKGSYPKPDHPGRVYFLQTLQKRWTRSASLDGFAGVALIWMMWPNFWKEGDFSQVEPLRLVLGLFILAGIGCILLGLVLSFRVVTPIYREVDALITGSDKK